MTPMETKQPFSRLQGFYQLSVEERRDLLTTLPLGLNGQDFRALDDGLDRVTADGMSENVIGTFSLPFSVAANFIVDEKPVLVPMVTEEPSIVAACSKMAKLVGANGGFFTEVDPSILKGQIQVYGLRDVDHARVLFHRRKGELMDFAGALPVKMRERGGGLLDIGLRTVPSDVIGPMLIIEPVLDVVDAMGANAINTLLESLTEKISAIFDGQVGIRILSNLCDQRLARARCRLNLRQLSKEDGRAPAMAMGTRVLAAHALAEADIYRACTHNKGILNGIDAVAVATGNDYRAIEAGAHAFAAIKGAYSPLTKLAFDKDRLELLAELIIPMAVGVVGGAIAGNRQVGFAHRLLGDFAKTSRGLSSVMVSVGLSQCLAALLALSTEGIQRGHMRLHRRKNHSFLIERLPNGVAGEHV